MLDLDNLDELDELDDDERDVLDNIMADPKKLKLFTTSKSIAEIKQEAAEVKSLYEMANTLFNQQKEEQKYRELKLLLTSQGVVDGEKLVIFTEHKDTLLYLQERLSNNGYTVATIHGGMTVDERREAQCRFMTPDVQILICTDAAGEGINLQFCRLLINWDIPWNPNRLEQRMGRIHRYGQKSDVIVFNMVASNTREGQVSKKMFPGYVLIHMIMNDDTWYVVRNTRGVTGFVGPGSKPVPLTDAEMRPLGIKAENVVVDFAEGDMIVVIGGVWKIKFICVVCSFIIPIFS